MANSVEPLITTASDKILDQRIPPLEIVFIIYKDYIILQTDKNNCTTTNNRLDVFELCPGTLISGKSV